MHFFILNCLSYPEFFSYKIQKGQVVKKGSIVSVPFGKTKDQIGMVIQLINTSPQTKKYTIKNIEIVFDSIVLNKTTIKFIK